LHEQWEHFSNNNKRKEQARSFHLLNSSINKRPKFSSAFKLEAINLKKVTVE